MWCERERETKNNKNSLFIAVEKMENLFIILNLKPTFFRKPYDIICFLFGFFPIHLSSRFSFFSRFHFAVGFISISICEKKVKKKNLDHQKEKKI